MKSIYYRAKTDLKAQTDYGVFDMYNPPLESEGNFTQDCISKMNPKALCIHCTAHCLNLGISNSTEVSASKISLAQYKKFEISLIHQKYKLSYREKYHKWFLNQTS